LAWADTVPTITFAVMAIHTAQCSIRFFYLTFAWRSDIKSFARKRRLMLTKRFTNEQLDCRSVALVCSSYLHDSSSLHCFVYLRSRRTKMLMRRAAALSLSHSRTVAADLPGAKTG